MKYKILIAHPIDEKKIKTNHPDFEIHTIEDINQKYQTVMDIITGYDGLLSLGHPVDRAMIDNGQILKIIANYGVGYDNIDIDYAKQKGIAVTNTPRSTTIVTANFTMGLILSLLRKIVATDRWIRKKDVIPFWGHNMILGTPIEGATLGIIGMGRIGKAVAHRARAFDMKILYHNRSRLSPLVENELKAQYLSFEQLLAQSDVITIHTPHTPTTQGMIDDSAFAKMKKGSFLINTSRGAVVHQEALIEALESGHLAGAALDVFEKEPYVPQELIDMENVILTPHNGSGTRAAREAMFEEAIGNIIAYLTGGKMTSRVV